MPISVYKLLRTICDGFLYEELSHVYVMLRDAGEVDTVILL